MKARSIALTPEEQADLELVVRRTTSAARDVFRAGVILRAASGASNDHIAAPSASPALCFRLDRDLQSGHGPLVPRRTQLAIACPELEQSQGQTLTKLGCVY